MSDTFEIACTECKISLWIGQTSAESETYCLYVGDAEVMLGLQEFLWEHKGHPLVFDETQTLGYAGITRRAS